MARSRTLGTRVERVLGAPTPPRLGRVQAGLVAAAAVLALARAREASALDSEDCDYTAAQAEALYLAYPAADADGDGVLSRDEACDFRAEHARATSELIAEPLCCNCDDALGPSPQFESTTCQEE
jgi:hypothetical protein